MSETVQKAAGYVLKTRQGGVAFLVLTFCFSIVLAASVSATDVAFWKPYAKDRNTYALIHFDGQGLAEAAGQVESGVAGGDAAFTDAGRFGGAAEFAGEGVVRFKPAAAYRRGYLSAEAWIYCRRYPEKEATVLSRPGSGGKSKGFRLFIDKGGRLHFRVRKMDGRTDAVSAGAKVPLREWVHVAGFVGRFPRHFIALYLNGRELQRRRTKAAFSGKTEPQPAPLYVGNDAGGESGFTGRIDEVRLHSNVYKFWPRDEMTWAQALQEREVPTGPPYLLSEPVFRAPLDGEETVGDHVIRLSENAASVPGVRGQALRGVRIGPGEEPFPQEGSIEFWMRPVGINNLSDRNHSLLLTGLFNLKFFNRRNSDKPLSLYVFREGGGRVGHFSDPTGTELHPGRWRHFVITWSSAAVKVYLDGKEIGRVSGERDGSTPWASIRGRSFEFSGHAAVDEIVLYDRPISEREVANAYFRYRDPSRLEEIRSPKLISLRAWFLPSRRRLRCEVRPRDGAGELERVHFVVRSEDGRTVYEKTQPVRSEYVLELPELKDGTCTLTASGIATGGRRGPGDTFRFVRRHFPWEGNEFGRADVVYPPFEPVRADGGTAEVVLRRMRMNGFGLWDGVLSQGRELLAAPMELELRYADGERRGAWEFSDRGFVSKRDHEAVYASDARAEGITVRARSRIEMDGCTRVEMDLLPGREPRRIEGLVLNIPLKAGEARLFHPVTYQNRKHYAGNLPEGTGRIWDSSEAWGAKSWLAPFVPYVWLGNPNRGLAWFAENDRGWIVRHRDDAPPLQELVREGDTVTLRIHLINEPCVVRQKHSLVFGLQASPTKPMPDGWRRKAFEVSGPGVSVHPWGSLGNSWKYPYNNDWEIVDKLIEAQLSGAENRAWFERYAGKHDPPPVRGARPWLEDVLIRRRYSNRPVFVFYELLKASTVCPEWRTFEDEWSPGRDAGRTRRWPDESIFRQGRRVMPSRKVNITRSYRDFGTYYGDRWMRRGISLYWDVQHPKPVDNPWTSAAYLTEEGKVQRAVALWNHRAYLRRVWNRMNHWRRHQEQPLDFCIHHTGTQILPLWTWGTVDYTLELTPQWDAHLEGGKPFPPDYIRTINIGRQVGNHPYLVKHLFHYDRDAISTDEPPEFFRSLREWGMRMVHEINRGNPYEFSGRDRAVFGFGYGTRGVEVHNYWADRPALGMSHGEVKWIALARPSDKALMVVLQIWSPQPGEVDLTFRPEVIGFDPGRHVRCARTGRRFSPNAQNAVTVPLSAPYATRVLYVTQESAEPEDAILMDDFQDGADMRWTYVSAPLRVLTGIAQQSGSGRNRAMRFGRNPSGNYLGPLRLEKWRDLPAVDSHTIRFRFRMEKVPESAGGLLEVCLRGSVPKLNKHGLSHTRLAAGQWAAIGVDGNGKWRVNVRGKGTRWNEMSPRNARKDRPSADTEWHRFRAEIRGGDITLYLDGSPVLEATGRSAPLKAFGLRASRHATADSYVEIDDVQVE